MIIVTKHVHVPVRLQVQQTHMYMYMCHEVVMNQLICLFTVGYKSMVRWLCMYGV